MPDPRFVAAQAHDAPYWIFSPSATPATVSFGNRFELSFTKAEFFAFLATLPDVPPPTPPPPPPPKPPAYSLEWRKVTTDKLNVRNAPNGAIVGSLKQGAVVQVLEGRTAGLYVWRNIVGKDWWIAEQYTALTTAPAPEPPPIPKPPPVVVPGTTDGYRRFGFNLCGPGSPNPLYAYQVQARQAGLTLGPSVITQEPKAVLGLDAEIVIYRAKITGTTEPTPLDYKGKREWSAQEWFNEWWPYLRAAEREPGRRLWVGWLNEVYLSKHRDFFIPFTLNLMDICYQHNPRIYMTYGNFAIGTLLPEDVSYWIPVLKKGMEQGHMLSGNSYWLGKHPESGAPFDEATSTRLFEYMLPLVRAVPGVPWLHGEYGFGDDNSIYPGAGRFAWLIRRGKVFDMPGFEGNALWCENGAGGGQQQSNIPESDFPALLQAVKVL